MTRLSTIHPYPAMIANELAKRLAEKYTNSATRLLDPFCGTGRTLLAAAEQGAFAVGLDVNPLACMITSAKAARVRLARLHWLIQRLPEVAALEIAEPKGFSLELTVGRKVQWFSARTQQEITALIRWLNRLRLDSHERILIAAILSATVREVSFCRNDQWKLHRLSSSARRRLKTSTLNVFSRRLLSVIQELSKAPKLSGSVAVHHGSALDMQAVLRANGHKELFDAIITSPPYGDSRTTVQYGAMSGISLAALRYLRGLDFEMMVGGQIDRECLGGFIPRSDKSQVATAEKRYWAGASTNKARRRVAHFLSELEMSCAQAGQVLRPGGKVIFVTSRRRVGGWRLYLDKFIVDTFESQNLSFEASSSRRIRMKVTPPTINRGGNRRKPQRLPNSVRTMREEQVLVFSKH